MAKLTRRAAVFSMMGLAGCASLPKIGPSRSQLMAGTTLVDGDTYVIPVTEDVAQYVNRTKSYGFSNAFREAGVLRGDVVQPGDRLSIVVWENVDNGLFRSEAGGATVLQDIQVDSDGFIFVPYAGRLRAAGSSPEAIRRLVVTRLSEQTPDPQVEVRRTAGTDAVVIVGGDVGAGGVIPLTAATSRLSGAIAAAGGAGQLPSLVAVTVVRGSHRGTIWYPDIFLSAANDVALRPGDRVVMNLDRRNYVVLGATGGQTVVPFDRPEVTALEAIATAGGLNSQSADATGVFVLRKENRDLIRNMARETPRSDRVMYLIDLLAPNGLFLAQDFQIQDGDVVYVTEAPVAQWNRTISTITGTIGTSASLGSSVGNLTN